MPCSSSNILHDLHLRNSNILLSPALALIQQTLLRRPYIHPSAFAVRKLMMVSLNFVVIEVSGLLFPSFEPLTRSCHAMTAPSSNFCASRPLRLESPQACPSKALQTPSTSLNCPLTLSTPRREFFPILIRPHLAPVLGLQRPFPLLSEVLQSQPALLPLAARIEETAVQPGATAW